MNTIRSVRQLCFLAVCICCGPAVAPAQTADVNGNGQVDMQDKALFTQALLGENSDPTQMARCDFNADGLVNGLDVTPFSDAMMGGDPGGGDVGACCVAGGGGAFDCVDVTADECAELGGDFQDAGTSCENSCPPDDTPGACCLQGPPITCVEASFAECDAQGGLFNGLFSTCLFVDCEAILTTGACCVPGPFGGSSCSVLSVADCNAQGGTFGGAGSSCNSVPCGGVPDAGACCIMGGGIIACSELTADECAQLEGTFFGAGTVCGGPTVDCPPGTVNGGACCVSSPGTVACFQANEADCLAQGGVFHGVGSDCDPVPCDDPTNVSGACCFEVPAACLNVSELLCQVLGGDFQGVGTQCDPDTQQCP